ncbi:hypothetical protein F5883DRAFT_507546 [Diaporthe sp. PMI_573]|nr:hypothetical protein F5883DRAFT_507546 [Diaporthaceae sp. PMI_573]
METSTSPLSSIRSISDPSAFNTPSPSSELQANTDTGIRRERRNGTEKLDLVWRYIVDEMNWSIGDFVRTLCTSDGQANARRKTAFARVAYQDLAVLDACIGRSGGPGTAESREHLIEYLDIGPIELRKEIASLARFKPFHKSQEAEDGGFERLDMRKLIETAEKTCPLLLRTLRGVIQPHSQVRGGYDNIPPQVDGVLVNILVVMCGTQRRNGSSGFQLQLSVYLHSKGVKRRQIEALHRLGLCCSYHKTLQVIKRQSEAAAEAVTLKGQQPTAVTAYDNFEQMEHVKEQRVDNENSFHSVTTGQLIEGIEMPEGGLLQSMQNQAARLRVQDIFCCPGNEADAAELE